MKVKSLIKTLNKNLDKKIKSSIISKYFKALDFFKYFKKSIHKNLSQKRNSLDHFLLIREKSPGVMSLSTLRRKIMKTIPASLLMVTSKNKDKGIPAPSWIKNKSNWLYAGAMVLIVATLLMLTACGGGGGGDSAPVGTTPSTPTTPVVTQPGITPTVTTFTAITLCASGPALTSTLSQAAANALVPGNCPALPASAYAATSVAAGSGTLTLTVSNLPSGFTGGTLAATKVTPSLTSNWDLVPTTTGNASATLRAGSAAVSFATVYNGTIEMNFVGAPSASKTITFTTGADPSIVVCTAPAMLNAANTCISPPAATGYTWNSVIKAWVANVGVRVFGANMLPVTCVNVGDACWLENVANGTIKFVQSDMIPQGLTITKTMNAYFKISNGPFGEAWVYTPLNLQGLSLNANPSVANGSVASNIDWVQGSSQINGVIVHQVMGNSCFNFSYLVTEGNFVSQSVTCPTPI